MPVLLEHRAEPRRDLHAAGERRAAAPALDSEFRYLEPRYIGALER